MREASGFLSLLCVRRVFPFVALRVRMTFSRVRPLRPLRPLRLLTLSTITIATTAHIGSPDVWFEGSAGPYHVVVYVKVPDVIPGIADISVRVPGAVPDRVTAVVN